MRFFVQGKQKLTACAPGSLLYCSEKNTDTFGGCLKQTNMAGRCFCEEKLPVHVQTHGLFLRGHRRQIAADQSILMLLLFLCYSVKDAMHHALSCRVVT